jgi:hypothetical protein
VDVPGKLRLTRELVMAHLTRCRAGALRGGVAVVTPADSCYGTASALMMRDERASFPAFTMQAMLNESAQTSPRTSAHCNHAA